jgi:hypothetical protein
VIEYPGDDQFMIELKKLFQLMYLQKGQEANPKPLVQQWTGWAGEPMNPNIQQDACEFVQMLIHKVENGLGKSFVGDLFTGTTDDRLDGLDVTYHAERSQPFVTYSLPIHKPDAISALKEAQNHYFTGDNKYRADGLGLINVKQFSTFGKLPRFLIMHLARFEYDYQTWRRSKLNTRFEFPEELDLKEFTLKPQDETRYHLTGIIVHQGTAEFGHYISFIKDGDRWLEFNDTFVTPVSRKNLFETAYGSGSKSAYLLFYTRLDAGTEVVDEPVIDPATRESIEIIVRRRNEQRLFCSSSYFALMRKLAELGNERAVKIAISYYFDTLPFTVYAKRARELYRLIVHRKTDDLCDYVLEYVADHPAQYQIALLYSPDLDIRTGAATILKCIDPAKMSRSSIEKFFVFSPRMANYYRVFTLYFEFIDFLISNSQLARDYAIESEWALFLTKLISQDLPNLMKARQVGLAEFWESFCLNSVLGMLTKIPCPESFADH